MIKKSGQKFKHGKKNEKSFYYEIKALLIILKGISAARNCLKPKSGPLTSSNIKITKNCL